MENLEGSFLKDKYWAKEGFRDAVEKSAENKKHLAEEDEFQISRITSI